MISKWKAVAALLLLACVLSLAWAINHYRNNAIDYKRQRDEATHNLKLASNTIADMKVRQRDVAALDAKYTGELADAKATIDQLERDVATGKRRLQLNARCPASGATSAGGMGDASSAELTGDAERNYWRLRDGIATVTKQVGYLQDYIKDQCVE